MRDILSKKAEALSKMNLPLWLVVDCTCCGKTMPVVSILGIGIELSPKMFGDVSVSYVCPYCSSLIENHYVGAMPESMDLASFLSLREPPSEPVSLEDIVSSPRSNLDV